MRLDRFKTTRVIDALKNRAMEDSDINLRATCAHALGRIKGEKAIDALIEVLKFNDGKDWEVYKALANAAGMKRAREIVIELIADHEIDERSATSALNLNLGGD